MNQLSPPKKKFPRAAAIEVAREMVRALEPVCERLIIAGSLRRRKEAVGDVEVLYIPKFKTETPEPPLDFFEAPVPIRVDLAEATLEDLVYDKVLAKRLNSLGFQTWGLKNKLALHVASGIPVDFFSTTPEAWGSYLVCRTGGAQNNIDICTAAQRRNLKWSPYEGFIDQGGNLLLAKTEQEVYELAGLPYREPWERE